MTILGTILLFCFGYYYTIACAKMDYYNESKENNDEYTSDVYEPLSHMILISFTLLAIIFFTIGCLMLHNLKRYFKDFYEQFGCRLWIANCAMTFPLLFRAGF